MLLVNDDFIFLHIPRTGGRFSSMLFNEYCDVKDISVKGVGIHKGIEFIPEEYNGYRLVTFVRDPFTWYRSRIHNILRGSLPGMTNTLTHRNKSMISANELIEMFITREDSLYTGTMKKMGLWENPDVEYYAFENICETLSKLIDVPVEVIRKREHFGASSHVAELSDRVKELIATKDNDLIIFHKQLLEIT